MRRLLPTLAFALLLVPGCGGGAVDREAEAPDTTSRMTAENPALPDTGIISEEAFKALHQLRQGEAPTLHGTMTEVDGARAYLSLPPGAKPPIPGVVVIHEWWGLNDNVKHWADRLAQDGYAALAPDLYGGRVATTPDSAMAYMKAADPARSVRILLAAERFLADDPRIKADCRGVIGWCFGGGYSLQTALHDPDLHAAVIYYGHPVTDVAELKRIHTPLLCVFGNLDPSIPPDTVTAFDHALTEAGVDHKIYRYDAVHAFANPSNAKYDEAAAEDAWRHVRVFLAEHLKGEPAR
jgi:carboxymethylenebutenolidase